MNHLFQGRNIILFQVRVSSRAHCPSSTTLPISFPSTLCCQQRPPDLEGVGKPWPCCHLFTTLILFTQLNYTAWVSLQSYVKIVLVQLDEGKLSCGKDACGSLYLTMSDTEWEVETVRRGKDWGGERPDEMNREQGKSEEETAEEKQCSRGAVNKAKITGGGWRRVGEETQNESDSWNTGVLWKRRN